MQKKGYYFQELQVGVLDLVGKEKEVLAMVVLEMEE